MFGCLCIRLSVYLCLPAVYLPIYPSPVTGCYKWENGDKYEGCWLCNMKHGNGVFYGSNGDVFEGSFDNDAKKSGIYKYNAYPGTTQPPCVPSSNDNSVHVVAI